MTFSLINPGRRPLEYPPLVLLFQTSTFSPSHQAAPPIPSGDRLPFPVSPNLFCHNPHPLTSFERERGDRCSCLGPFSSLFRYPFDLSLFLAILSTAPRREIFRFFSTPPCPPSYNIMPSWAIDGRHSCPPRLYFEDRSVANPPLFSPPHTSIATILSEFFLLLPFLNHGRLQFQPPPSRYKPGR